MFMLKDMHKKLQQNKLKAFCLVLMFLTLFIPVSSQIFDRDYMNGFACFKKGDYQNAVKNLSMAISHNNADEQLYIKRGESYLKIKDIDNAILDFKEANMIVPGIADLWLARSFALSGDNANAVLYLTKHLSSDFRLSEDSIKKDESFDDLQSSEEWFALWQHEWYENEEKVITEAVYYSGKHLYDEAIAYLNAEIEKAPENIDLIACRGKVYLQQENLAAAIADYSRAIKLDKGENRYYENRGMAYLKAERFKEAEADLSRAIKNNAVNFDLYLLRARAFAGLKAWENSIKDVQLYLTYFENDHLAIYQCGEYYFQSEDFINALKCFNINLKDDPNNSLYYKARGKTYVKTSTYSYAISDLAMSLDLNPDDAETWMYMGIAKIRSNAREGGCSDLEKSRHMGNAEALQYIIELCR
jgi:tetratricopeptide (TPR) repeat protein